MYLSTSTGTSYGYCSWGKGDTQWHFVPSFQCNHSDMLKFLHSISYSEDIQRGHVNFSFKSSIHWLLKSSWVGPKKKKKGQGVDPVWENDMRSAGSSPSQCRNAHLSEERECTEWGAPALLYLKKGSTQSGELQTCFDCTPLSLLPPLVLPGSFPGDFLIHTMSWPCHLKALVDGTHKAWKFRKARLPRPCPATPLWPGFGLSSLGCLTWDTVMPHFLASSSLASSLG